MPIIEVKDLNFSYGDEYNAINGVSFTIDEGKYYSIIGHNGSGKSTISKLLMGLLEAKSGSIVEFGVELNRKTVRELRRRIGIVFQNPDNQFIGSTVRDDIAFGMENRCVNREDMIKAIDDFSEKVNMKQFLDKEPENLSGGQKQRVAIAGVLAMNPEVIIFDEATSMLDPKGRKEIREVILKMKDENPKLTIISITHDIEEAFDSDRIIALDKGQIVMDGTPSDLLSNQDLLRKIGLSVPFKNLFVQKMKEAGIQLNESESLERIVDELCR